MKMRSTFLCNEGDEDVFTLYEDVKGKDLNNYLMNNGVRSSKTPPLR